MSPAEVMAAFVDIVGHTPRTAVAFDELLPILRAPLDGDAAAMREHLLQTFANDYRIASDGKLGDFNPAAPVIPGSILLHRWPEQRRPLKTPEDAAALTRLLEACEAFERLRDKSALSLIVLEGNFSDPDFYKITEDLFCIWFGLDARAFDQFIEIQTDDARKAHSLFVDRLKIQRPTGSHIKRLWQGPLKHDLRKWKSKMMKCARQLHRTGKLPAGPG